MRCIVICKLKPRPKGWPNNVDGNWLYIKSIIPILDYFFDLFIYLRMICQRKIDLDL
jgi:hypothetical protein